MILLDIQVPEWNSTYDFELDEEMQTKEALQKVVQILTEQENVKGCCAEEMMLYDLQHEKVLNLACSLKEQGVKSGETLYLI